MKKTFIALFLAISCCIATAVTLNLQWCPTSDPTVTGYRVYYSATNKIAGWAPVVYTNGTNCPPGAIISNGTNWLRSYQTNITVGLTNFVSISNAVVGKTYYVSVKAYNAVGLESDWSNEAEKTVTNFPPSAPVNLQIIDVK
jgi:hypothetical protein